VPREHRGAGLASQLTVRALEYAREHGYRVRPTCPFVAAYLERHPEYRDLRA
jgi:predicted GNAT family acetyltransferase